MSGRRSRDKGARREREVVALHEALGIPAARVPLSGACGGRFSGDVDIYIDGPDATPMVTEVKARKSGSGFVTLEKWLGENDALFLRRDRAGHLVLLPWSTWCRRVGRRL